MLFTMMSLFFCGHVGSDELAAVALANTVSSFFIVKIKQIKLQDKFLLHFE